MSLPAGGAMPGKAVPPAVHPSPCDCCGAPIYALRCGVCLRDHGYPHDNVVKLRRPA